MLDLIFSWDTLWVLLMIVYVPVCLGLIIIVLLQKGKGAGFAGAFGVGPGSEAVFGPRASRSLPVRLTQISAGLFLFLALVMSIIAGKVYEGVAPGIVEEDAPLELTSGAETGQALEELGLGERTAGDTALPADASATAEETGAAAIEIDTNEPALAVEPEGAAAPVEAPATTPEAPETDSAPAGN